MKNILIDSVIQEIKNDININNEIALFNILKFVPDEELLKYLPEEKTNELKFDWVVSYFNFKQHLIADLSLFNKTILEAEKEAERNKPRACTDIRIGRVKKE